MAYAMNGRPSIVKGRHFNGRGRPYILSRGPFTMKPCNSKQHLNREGKTFQAKRFLRKAKNFMMNKRYFAMNIWKAFCYEGKSFRRK